MSELLAPEDLLDEEGDEGALTTDTLTRGTRLGRYELLLPIAMGGMAKVWAARQRGHRGFSKLVAIKTILPNLSEDPAFESMFLDEARIASNVHHPNVCDIYELGEEGKVLYLAMEWVNGDSLMRVLRANGVSERIDPRIAARIVADACAGVHAAHELSDDLGRPLGVVHRDMSPHNILMSADGNVKVTDFGVAKAIGQLHDQTSTGTLKGKINYMAPEQITGTHIDRRSDVFALGCVLYEATTGRLAFRDKGQMDHEVMQRVMQGQFVPPSRILPGYPAELDGIVVRAMANQPIQRFATAERLRLALEEWLQMSGPIVTESQVAAAVRARVGTLIDRRRERIRVAMSTTGPKEDSNATPNPSASGVVPAGTGSASGTASRRGPLTMSPLTQPLMRAPSRPDGPGAFTVPPVPPPLNPPPPPPLPSQFQASPAPPQVGYPGAQGLPPAVGVQSPAPVAPFPEPLGGMPLGLQAPPEGTPANVPAARHYAVAVGIGVSVALAVGVGAFLLWRLTRAPEPSTVAPLPTVTAVAAPVHGTPPTSSAPTAVVPSAVVALPVAPGAVAPSATITAEAPPAVSAADSVAPPSSAATTAGGGGTAPAPPSTGEVAAPDEPIVLTIPDGATVFVAGAPLADGAHTVPRPKAGQTLNVIVRAAGYDDAFVTLNATTSSPLDVALHKRQHHHVNPSIPANPY